jgi:hypothetical protein
MNTFFFSSSCRKLEREEERETCSWCSCIQRSAHAQKQLGFACLSVTQPDPLHLKHPGLTDLVFEVGASVNTSVILLNKVFFFFF